MRMIFAGNMMLPGDFAGILYGVQGGIGQIGVYGSSVNEDGSASPTAPKFGTVYYIDAVETYYGWNTGFSLFLGDISIFVSQQFDYHYFIDGPPETYAKGGTRRLTELTVFPFDSDSSLEGLGLKLSYRVNDMPYLNEFVDWTEEKISYQNKGVGFTLLYII